MATEPKVGAKEVVAKGEVGTEVDPACNLEPKDTPRTGEDPTQHSRA